MKMKKGLSLLAALCVLLSIFGVFGVFAAWEAPEAGFALSLKSADWEYKEISWTLPAEVEPAALRYDWLVKTAGGITVPITERNGLAAQVDSTANALVLIVQPGAIRNFGQLTVTLTVNSILSAPVSFWLLDDDALAAKAEEVQALAANPNGRYSDAYVTLLKDALKDVDALYANEVATPALIEAQIAALDAAIAQVSYRLTGLAALDDLVADIVPGFWSFVDTIAAPFRWLQDVPDWSVIGALIKNTLIAMFSF
ncbi:MAG: hypothetical protein LBQ33_05820 [Oscillospiraceae bacterium]|jgi:hypothetical protein|nr:hypothetical protein [Oscillospiraceae bacterium]